MLSTLSGRALGAGLALALAATVTASEVAAEPVRRAPRMARVGDLVVGPAIAGAAGEPIVLARQLVPAQSGGGGASGVAPGLAQSRVIYLNRNGITVSPGASDSRVNRSSLVDRPRSISPWLATEAAWSATKACVAEMFSRFAVAVTDEDPGQVPHIEAVLGGTPQQLGISSGISGISPFALNCSVLESSIVFVFTGVIAASPQRICEIATQEIAHSYGLDHELLPADPMTYLSHSGERSFQDARAACGETEPRPCGIGSIVCRESQNSVALLGERLGAADPSVPQVSITAPADGATVAPAFRVTATAIDDIGVASADLFVDGELVASLEGAGPFAFPTSVAMAPGAHTIDVEVTDGERAASASIRVTVAGAGDGEEDDSGLIPGCAAGGGAAGAGSAGCAAVAMALAALLHRRRRSRAIA